MPRSAPELPALRPQWQSTGSTQVLNAVSADPLFATEVSPLGNRASLASKIKLDFTLRPGSSCAGKGSSITSIAQLLSLGSGGATSSPTQPAPQPTPQGGSRKEQRVPMTRLRARIAERLLQAQQQAAMLTTFNEVDMTAVMALRQRYQEQFTAKHGIKLGFMSFFVKASVEALRQFPVLNASVDGNDIIYHEFFDIGVAVSTDRGLVVPVLRNAEAIGFGAIEQKIRDFGERARKGSLQMEELPGGTFTITNGGIFGSLMSTPILNPPQSGILGMHKIQERAMVVGGKIEARPMMYLALTYDHRIVDGREAVQFLVHVKDLLEDPARLLLEI